MPFRVFTIPVSHGSAAEAELNAFLRTHKVLQVDRRLIDEGASSFWTFCVDYADPTPSGSGVASDRTGSTRPRVDYR